MEVEGARARPFAEVVLDAPELAACHALAPGSWPALRPPAAPLDAPLLAELVRSRLAGVIGAGAPARYSVVVGESEASALNAVAFGATALLIVPATVPWTAEDGARAVLAAFARAHFVPAPRDPRCSEPLLSLAETLSAAGSLALATLPPELRPVAEWLEPDDAAQALASFAADALDRDAAWSARRVRLQQTALTSGANAQLANAAALLVEAYGDPRRARAAPYELLLAWHADREKRFPRVPPTLRRALSEPLAAGMPNAKRAEDEPVIAAQALARAVETGSLPPGSRLDGASAALRALAAARARAAGDPAACAFLLAGPVAGGLRTGCRADEGGGGFVAARPRPQGGFEVVAAAGGDEVVLLRWPRWALSPLVAARDGVLAFADAEGMWSVALDGSRSPRLLASGEYRHLALAPDGATVAAVRWTSGTPVVVTDGGVRELAGEARGGLAWLDGDLLAIAGGDGAAVVSMSDERRPLGLELPCPHALARLSGALLVGAAAPCAPGIHALPLAGGAAGEPLVRGDGPASVVVLRDGAVLFTDPGGVFRWRPGEAPVRVGAGLTVGPG